MTTSLNASQLKFLLILLLPALLLSTYVLRSPNSSMLPSGSAPSLRPKPDKYCKESLPRAHEDCVRNVEKGYDAANMQCLVELIDQQECNADCSDFVEKVDRDSCVKERKCGMKVKTLNECVDTIVKGYV